MVMTNSTPGFRPGNHLPRIALLGLCVLVFVIGHAIGAALS